MAINLNNLPIIRIDITENGMTMQRVVKPRAGGYYIDGKRMPDWMVREAMRKQMGKSAFSSSFASNSNQIKMREIGTRDMDARRVQFRNQKALRVSSFSFIRFIRRLLNRV